MILYSLLFTSLTLIIANLLAYFTDFTAKGYNKFIALISGCVIILLMSTAIGTGISIMASNDKCGQYIKKDAFKKGLKSGIIITLVYLFVFLMYLLRIPYLKGPFINPFLNIGGEKYANSYGLKYLILCFWSLLISWCTTATMYYQSQKDGCILSNNELAQFKQKLDKDLETKKEKKRVKKFKL